MEGAGYLGNSALLRSGDAAIAAETNPNPGRVWGLRLSDLRFMVSGSGCWV